MGYQTNFSSPGGKMGGSSPSLSPGYQFWGNNQMGAGANPYWSQFSGTNAGIMPQPLGMGMGMPYGAAPPIPARPAGMSVQPGLQTSPPVSAMPPSMGLGGGQGPIGPPIPASPPSMGVPPSLQRMPPVPAMNYYPMMGWGSGH